MKDFRHLLLLSLLVFLSAATLTCAAAAPAIEVVVSSSAGKIFYKGRIDAKGTFATPSLAAGNYVVQFNSESSVKGGPFALVVNAGKKKIVADSVPAGKFSKGGVAMRVEVTRAASVTGQVAEAGAAITGTTDTKGNAKVKYINGKKYVWVPAELGSSLGGKWVEAGSSGARNVESVNRDDVRQLQDRGDPRPPANAGGH